MYELEMLPAWAGRKPEIVEEMLAPRNDEAEVDAEAVQAQETTAAVTSNGTNPTNGAAPITSSVAEFDADPAVSEPVLDNEEALPSIADFDASSTEPETEPETEATPPDPSPEVDVEVEVDVDVADADPSSEAEIVDESEWSPPETAAPPTPVPDADSVGPFLREEQEPAPMLATDQEFDGSVVATIDHHFGPEHDSFDEPDVGAPRTLLALAILLTVAIVAIGVGLLAGYFFTR